MAATTDDIARLRRLAAEPTTQTYTDADLATVIERYELTDADGYDLNAAAADIWEEKSAAVAANYDVKTESGATFTVSQVYENCTRMARHFRARRAIRTLTARPEPMEG